MKILNPTCSPSVLMQTSGWKYRIDTLTLSSMCYSKPWDILSSALSSTLPQTVRVAHSSAERMVKLQCRSHGRTDIAHGNSQNILITLWLQSQQCWHQHLLGSSHVCRCINQVSQCVIPDDHSSVWELLLTSCSSPQPRCIKPTAYQGSATSLG